MTMKRKSGVVFAIFIYKYDDESGKFVVADDPSGQGKPVCRAVADPDAVLREAKDMIFTALIREYKGTGSMSDQVLAAMDKAVESAGATLVRLPRSADIDGDVGFLMGQLGAPEGDQGNFAYVRALAVKAKDDLYLNTIMKYLPGVLLSAVNHPEKA